MEYVLIFRTEGMLLVLGRIFFAHRKNHVIREKVMLLIQRLATIQGDVEPTLLQMNQIVISLGEAKEEAMVRKRTKQQKNVNAHVNANVNTHERKTKTQRIDGLPVRA